MVDRVPAVTEARDRDLVVLSQLTEPVRRDLYDWVVAQDRQVGRAEAAKALAITRVLATFHLDRLGTAGLSAKGYRRLPRRAASRATS